MSKLIIALGVVLATEGLVLALAPKRIEDALALILRLSIDQRRLLGLGGLALGVLILWIARAFAG